MARPVLMPTFGLTEGQATVTRWLKSIGDVVQRDESLFEAETEKATVEVPAPVSGVLLQILVAAGQDSPLAAIVAWIGQKGETPPSTEERGEVYPQSADKIQQKETAEPTAEEQTHHRASPVARRLAREHGIGLSTIEGSGPGGRIVLADIQRAVDLQRQPSSQVTLDQSAGEPSSIPMSHLRSVTARRLAVSARDTVPVPLLVNVDMSEAKRLRDSTRGEFERVLGAACSYNAVILRACAVVLREHPALNAHWTETGPRQMSDVNIGLAVAVDDGLLVPVIRDAAAKSLREIQAAINLLIEKARSKRLLPDEVAGGTFTVTSLGSQGIDAFAPVINPPQVAILGVGRIADRVVAVSGQPAVRPVATLCLVFDHRALDGLLAASALVHIKQLLENPYLLI